MSELKLSWPVTLTGDPPAVISRPANNRHQALNRLAFMAKIIDKGHAEEVPFSELISNSGSSLVLTTLWCLSPKEA